jgi:hypothetical protein
MIIFFLARDAFIAVQWATMSGPHPFGPRGAAQATNFNEAPDRERNTCQRIGAEAYSSPARRNASR